MKKKFLSMMLSGILAVGLLAGCGNSSDTDNGKSSSKGDYDLLSFEVNIKNKSSNPLWLLEFFVNISYFIYCVILCNML